MAGVGEDVPTVSACLKLLSSTMLAFESVMEAPLVPGPVNVLEFAK